MNFANRDYQEKRNFIRMKVDTPVDIHILANGEHHAGVCRDLSGGGLLVESPTAFPVGTQAEVEIKSTHGHSPMLQAKVRVSRVESQPDRAEHPCLLGMEIEEVITDS